MTEKTWNDEKNIFILLLCRLLTADCSDWLSL